MLVIFAVCAIFLYGMIVLAVYYTVNTYRRRDVTCSPFINYLWIVFIGLFLVSLLMKYLVGILHHFTFFLPYLRL
jgi:hypothetical protein